MGQYTDDLIRLLYPAREVVVTLTVVEQIDGIWCGFTSTADFEMVKIGYRSGCNDWPEAGQRWEISVVGQDVASGIWIAHALIRSD